MRGASCLFVLLTCSRLCGAQTEYFSVPPVDAPQLAARGDYSVGVRTLDVVHPDQVDILHFDTKTSKAPLYNRPLKLEVWYPAIIPPGQTEATVYTSAMSGTRTRPGVPKTFEIAGKALRDAAPVKGSAFPLVIVSHGYPGSRTFLTYLTENLASKGYVVAAIDHTDSVFGEVKEFASTLLNRSSDQLFTIDTLTRQSKAPGNFLSGIVDVSKVAIVGYSMGGYGAVESAGAGFSSAGMPAKLTPGQALGPWTAESAAYQAIPRDNLRAVVAIAPWGAQPPYNAWETSAFAGIRIPSLFIVGDQDDVSGYEDGVKRIFDGSVNSDRCLLVYENARHNVGGNPPPPIPLDFIAEESFTEPAWRKDRITAINQHFITAFLDLYLKGDESRRSYLHVTPEKSNDGVWPLKQDESAGASYAADGQKYWKGFQRRWAVGLEMHCAAAAK